MTKALENKELIEYFEDGISRAIEAIKPSQLLITHMNGPEFLDGLKYATQAANGLAHTQANPMWLKIRDTLDSMITTFKQIIISGRQPPRKNLEILLRRILHSATAMAASKSMPRQEVLVALGQRKQNHAVH